MSLESNCSKASHGSRSRIYSWKQNNIFLWLCKYHIYRNKYILLYIYSSHRMICIIYNIASASNVFIDKLENKQVTHNDVKIWNWKICWSQTDIWSVKALIQVNKPLAIEPFEETYCLKTVSIDNQTVPKTINYFSISLFINYVEKWR